MKKRFLLVCLLGLSLGAIACFKDNFNNSIPQPDHQLINNLRMQIEMQRIQAQQQKMMRKQQEQMEKQQQKIMQQMQPKLPVQEQPPVQPKLQLQVQVQVPVPVPVPVQTQLPVPVQLPVHKVKY